MRFLLAAATVAMLLAVFAPTAGAQVTRDVTVDFTQAGAGPLPRDFFFGDGLLFDDNGFVSVVEGDDASGFGATTPMEGAFATPITALAVRVAPSLRGLEQFFLGPLTTELTLTALDDSQRDGGFGNRDGHHRLRYQ